MKMVECLVKISPLMGSKDAIRTFSVIYAIFMVHQRSNIDAGRLPPNNMVNPYSLAVPCEKIRPGMFVVDTETRRSTMIPLKKNLRRARVLHGRVREATDIFACFFGDAGCGVQPRLKPEAGGTYQRPMRGLSSAACARLLVVVEKL